MHAGMYARRVFCVIVTVGLASAIAQPAAAQNPFTINGLVPDTGIAAVRSLWECEGTRCHQLSE